MRQKIRTGLLMGMFCLFPAVYYYMSPYLIIEGTAQGIVTGSFLLFLFMFLSSMIFGRFYCGWLCPAAGIQEAMFPANGRKIRRGNFIKWIFWIIWLGTIILVAVKNRGYHSIDPFYKTFHGLSVNDVMSFIIYLMVLLLIFLPSLIIGKRSFCHHLCWMSPFMILGEKLGRLLTLPRLELVTEPEKCVSCHLCSRGCPMSLDVEALVQTGKIGSGECIKCMKCIDVCRKDVIKAKFTRKKFTRK